MLRKWTGGTELLNAVFAVVLIYFLFKVTLIITLFPEDQQLCLSHVWSGKDDGALTPFFAFLLAAMASAVWFFTHCARSYRTIGKAISLLAGVGLIFFYYWFKGFYGFWQLLEYEKDNITLEQFISNTGGSELYKYYKTNNAAKVLCNPNYKPFAEFEPEALP
ncbi:hypothetical protein [Arsukibacterium ikkense]|uniref:hypothetical protein n=1 Tax=Arsukibacterium ikkense TaxID=336831 RepID=UPI00128BECD5|nr:hypothetical protein [Arsukibacterium ikkense]